jgi:hypothetical protein
MRYSLSLLLSPIASSYSLPLLPLPPSLPQPPPIAHSPVTTPSPPLQVNASPSLSCTTEADRILKLGLLRDIYAIVTPGVPSHSPEYVLPCVLLVCALYGVCLCTCIGAHIENLREHNPSPVITSPYSLTLHPLPSPSLTLHYHPSGCKSLLSLQSQSRPSSSSSSSSSAWSSHPEGMGSGPVLGGQGAFPGSDPRSVLRTPALLSNPLGGFYVLYDETKEKERDRERDRERAPTGSTGHSYYSGTRF